MTIVKSQLAVPTSISKHLKYDDLGFALMENGHFQCLACSRTYISKSGDPGFPENLVLWYEAFDTETTTSFDTQTAKLFVKKTQSRIEI